MKIKIILNYYPLDYLLLVAHFQQVLLIIQSSCNYTEDEGLYYSSTDYEYWSISVVDHFIFVSHVKKQRPEQLIVP